MNDYSEIIYIAGAMLLFSMLSLNTNRSFNKIKQSIYVAETENRAITVAQNEIDKIKSINNPVKLNRFSKIYLFKNYPISKTITYGKNNEYSSTFIIHGTSDVIENNDTMKRYQVVISVINQEVTPEVLINLEYVKSFKM